MWKVQRRQAAANHFWCLLSNLEQPTKPSQNNVVKESQIIRQNLIRNIASPRLFSWLGFVQFFCIVQIALPRAGCSLPKCDNIYYFANPGVGKRKRIVKIRRRYEACIIMAALDFLQPAAVASAGSTIQKKITKTSEIAGPTVAEISLFTAT